MNTGIESKQADVSYLRKGGLVLVLVAVGGFLADYLFNLGLTRILSPHAYGDYKIAYAFASIAGIAVLMGGDRAAPRYLSGWLDQGQGGAVSGYLLFFTRVALGTSVVVLVGVLLAFGLHRVRLDPERHHAMVVAVIAVPLIGVGALLSRTLQSAKHLGMAALPWRVGFPVLKLVLILVAAWWLETVHVFTVIILAIVAILLVGGSQLVLIIRLKLVSRPTTVNAAQYLPWLRLSAPMMVTMLVAMGLRQADLLLLEVLGEEHHVGFFAAAATVAHLVMITQMTVIALVAPLIGPSLDAGIDAMRFTFRRGQRLMLWLIVPATLLLMVTGPVVLKWFGKGYDSGYPALLMLLAGYLLWALSGLASTFLQYGGKGRQVLWVNLLTLLIAVVLNFLLIPRYDMTGAGIATAVAFGAGAILSMILYRVHRNSLCRVFTD